MRDMWCPRGWMDTCIRGGSPGVRQDATARAACRQHLAPQPWSCIPPCQPCLSDPDSFGQLEKGSMTTLAIV